MQRLTSQQILAVWELGNTQAPSQRALILASYAEPLASRELLAKLPLGLRNQKLLQLREQLFGQNMACVLPCPQCSELLEFNLNTQQLIQNTDNDLNSPLQLDIEGFELVYRLLTTEDLQAALLATDCRDYQALEQALLARCLQAINREGKVSSYEELSEKAKQAFIKQLEQSDPLAEIKLDLVCPGCEKSWQGLFDIVSFLWEELAQLAQRLLAEVHQLALAYGWSEQAILDLSKTRRQYYLQRIAQC